MADFDGTPFLKIVVQILIDKGVSGVVFLAGHLAQEIETYFLDNPLPVPVGFSIEKEPLGTGGALKKAAHEFLRDGDKEVLIVNGDTFFDLDLGSLLVFHRSHTGLLSLALSKTEQANDYGTVELEPTGRIHSFKEKSEDSGYIYGGYYLADQDYFALIPENRLVSAELEVFPKLVETGQIYGLYQDKDFFDIGTPERFHLFKNWIRTKSF